MTESYICPRCGHTEDRPYRVRLIILTCPACEKNGQFLHISFRDQLEAIPEDARPSGWREMPLDEQMEYAIREGLIEIDLTGPMEE
ncbi:hypothetical protein [Haloquadratum walsbyi]|uniref:Small CPxCG-related zinc finger protein n=2 Tax=Haloquadratum walsbyi TaxID=293091 RepID=Q18H90_HALWD|nr:hypothetical protein [Haloquadratum walsbyi]CAJ52653.1 small CPxCG-related zinc finger protein [Haloquadratum walsbyi DSM 16790]CCC40654.1 small CPxCG-related zinc finger protein [Haloquadratum walsbyi C23]